MKEMNWKPSWKRRACVLFIALCLSLGITFLIVLAFGKLMVPRVAATPVGVQVALR